MKQTVTLFFLLNTFLLTAQTIADFEALEIPAESFLDGSDGSGGFSSGNIFLPNTYNPEFFSWSGWAISNTTDTITPGFTNQYSAIAGSGAEGSATYALSFIFGESIMRLSERSTVNGLFLTNNTYAYLSMLEGDDFAKKFGGATGDDPDFYRLTIKKYLEGQLSQDSVDFYLADYRFENNSQDYIVDDWTFIDLSALGEADSLSFSVASTDVGQFGINTPTYVCIDQVSTSLSGTTAIDFVPTEELFQLYPNPTTNFLQLNSLSQQPVEVAIYSMTGQLVFSRTATGNEVLDISPLSQGTYMLHVVNDKMQASQLLVKQ